MQKYRGKIFNEEVFETYLRTVPSTKKNALIGSAIFQNVNLGYAVCGIKYLEMIANNQNIVITALGYALQKMNEFAKENEGLAYENEVLKHNANLGSEEPSGVEDKELKGISES